MTAKIKVTCLVAKDVVREGDAFVLLVQPLTFFVSADQLETVREMATAPERIEEKLRAAGVPGQIIRRELPPWDMTGEASS